MRYYIVPKVSIIKDGCMKFVATFFMIILVGYSNLSYAMYVDGCPISGMLFPEVVSSGESVTSEHPDYINISKILFPEIVSSGSVTVNENLDGNNEKCPPTDYTKKELRIRPPHQTNFFDEYKKFLRGKPINPIMPVTINSYISLLKSALELYGPKGSESISLFLTKEKCEDLKTIIRNSTVSNYGTKLKMCSAVQKCKELIECKYSEGIRVNHTINKKKSGKK